MKKVLAIVIGVVAGFAVMFMGEATTSSLSPMPAGLNTRNRDEMRVFIESIPMYVLVLLIIFWLASSFLGAMLASRINRSNWKNVSIITGSILLATTILNMAMLPHPAWMWITVLAGYIPAALLGGWLVRPKSVPLP